MSKKLPTTDRKNINRLPTWADIINICFQKKEHFVFNLIGTHGVPDINLSNFMCLLVDFVKVLCSRAPAKLKYFFWRKLHSTNIDCFVRDSSHLHLTYVAFCVLSVKTVIRKTVAKTM